MAVFTTTVRRILEKTTGEEYPDEQIEKGKAIIFTKLWTTGDTERDDILKGKILRHFYFREIGFETYGLWKFKINEELYIIMPKYKVLYDNLEKITNDLLNNVNLTESGNSSSTESGESTNSGNSKSNSENTSKSSGDTTSNGTGSGNSDAWQTANDTPQGGLDGIESNRYLSSAVHNKSATDQTSASSSNSNTTASSSATNTGETTSSGTTKSNTTGEYVKKIIGKNSGTEYIDLYSKLVTEYTNIDKMIIDELEPLFMGLWE